MADNWGRRRVLITGATGIIGSWLTEELAARGASVTAFIKKNDPIGIESIRHVKSKVRLLYGNITNKRDVEKAVKDQELIFHLAAVTQVLYAADNPAEAVEVNLGGTMNLLEAMRKGNRENFLVMTSTDKVYGEPAKLPITEDHPLSSKSPYDAAKLAADRMVYAYAKTYGIKSTIMRFSNIYGGRDSNELRIIPGCITSIMRGKTPVIRRSGQDLRDYMHVSDAVRAYLAVAENQSVSNQEAFNFGTGKPTKTIDVVNMVSRAMGFKGKPTIMNRNIQAEIDRQYMGYEKAMKMLSWKPMIELDKGIKMTVDWYRANSWWLDVVDRASKGAHQMRR